MAQIILTLKKSMCISLSLLLLLSGTTMAAPEKYQSQEQAIRQSLVELQRLKEITEILKLNSTEAQKRLIEVQEELRLSKLELAELRQELEKSKKSLAVATALLEKQQDSLTQLNKDFEAYSKTVKAKIKSLETKNTVLTSIAGVLVGVLVWTTVK